MFGLTFEKIIIIGVIAAFVIGPERLPHYASMLAKFVRQLRDFTNGAKNRMKEEMGPDFDEVEWKKLDPRQYDPRRIIRDALLEDPTPDPVKPSATMAGGPLSGAAAGGAAVAGAASTVAESSGEASGAVTTRSVDPLIPDAPANAVGTAPSLDKLLADAQPEGAVQPRPEPAYLSRKKNHTVHNWASEPETVDAAAAPAGEPVAAGAPHDSEAT